jgi:hypothetical protein
MRPAEVCGWLSRPRSVSWPITLRAVAADIDTLRSRTTWAEATGSAVATYCSIRARSTACWRERSFGALRRVLTPLGSRLGG